MRIGQICEKTALTKDTIRFYEKKGLIVVKQGKSAFNNYKEYTEQNLQRLLMIKKAKRFGFTLNEIAELLDLADLKQANCTTLREKIQNKIEDIDHRIQELQEMKAMIYQRIQNASNSCGSGRLDENCQQIFN